MNELQRIIKYTIIFFIIINCIISCKNEIIANEEPLVWVTEAITAPNISHQIFYSQSAKSDVSFHIYLPDEYNANPNKEFPVLYYLHGTGGGLEGINPITTHFKNAMNAGKIPAMIIVFPNGLPLGMWCNSKDGKQPVEYMLINDLIPHIDNQYRTIKSRNGRIVEGFSMGGYGALRLGLKYSSIFAGFSSIAGGPLQLDFSVVSPSNEYIQPIIFNNVYGNDMNYFESQSPWIFAELFGQSLPNPTPKRIVVGKADYVYIANKDFHNRLNDLSISHQFVEFENLGHNALALFGALGENNWLFYNAVFR